MVRTVTHTVGNRELILGIDEMYRAAMKVYEAEKLLPAAQQIVDCLSLEISEVPVEGYYGENGELTAYFRMMRTLQQVHAGERPRVEALSGYALLRKVTHSPLFGVVEDTSKLFPASRDSLYFALGTLPPSQWAVETITGAAYREAVVRSDCSLVGLACLARDPVCIAALRETVVLYAELLCGMSRERIVYVYEWAVEPALEEAANRFIEAFSEIVGDTIPPARAENAARFFRAYLDNDISGRCVRIGFDDRTIPNQHYHWAVAANQGTFVVEDFWRDEIWTTDRYRRERP